MGGVVSAGEDNEELIDNLVEADYVKSAKVERAMRLVDRGDYYLEGQKDSAYKDTAWKSGNLHISAPCIYSEVLESLEFSPGLSFLNLGSGTGYLSTIVGLLIGSKGFNHGVELHADVVEYAKQRLSEFIKNSSAIDLSDFCSPEYIVGNCLLLEPGSMGIYDRIYCGAGVPEENANFIKRLIRVGGIVVMPCGDQLKQFRRTGLDIEYGFEEKNVLPVSFATLVVPPTPQQMAKALTVYLPDRQPLRLQELCRCEIRAILRSQVESELPDLQMRCVVLEKEKKANSQVDDKAQTENNAEQNSTQNRPNRGQRRRRLRRVLMPVFRQYSDPEDEEDDAEDGEQQRRRIRRQIIAIGTAGLARGPEGRIQMQTLRWNRFTMSPNNNGGDGETGGTNEGDVEQTHEEEVREHDEVEGRDEEDMEEAVDQMPALSVDPDMEGMLAKDDQGTSTALVEPISDCRTLLTVAEPQAQLEAEPVCEPDDNNKIEEEDKEPTVVWINKQRDNGNTQTVTNKRRSVSESSTGSTNTRQQRKRRPLVGNIVEPEEGTAAEPIECGTSDSSDEDEEEKEKKRHERKAMSERNHQRQEEFSERIKSKIRKLPLPEKLRNFINYSRD